MFDWINVPDVKCPHCEFLIPSNSGWQSKDGQCVLETLQWHEVTNFYLSCPDCKKWVEFRRKKQNPTLELTELYEPYE